MSDLRSFCLIIDNVFYCLSHILHEVRFDFIFFFSSASIIEQLSEVDVVSLDGIFKNMPEFSALIEIKQLLIGIKIHQYFLQQRNGQFCFVFDPFFNRRSGNQFFDNDRIIASGDVKINSFFIRIQVKVKFEIIVEMIVY